jgi:excisionase family DNA binding protein
VTRDPETLLDVHEAAALLGVPASHLYMETRKGAASRIPHLKVGRYLRFRRADLLRWIESATLGGQPVEPAPLELVRATAGGGR